MQDETGLSGYQSVQGSRRPGPRQIFEMMLRKTQLRSLLEIEAAKIAEALPYLNKAETEQLQSMLAGEVADCDADVAALSEQVNREAALAASTKAMDLRLDRESSRAIQDEMLRQIEIRGFCPAPAQLAAEAIKRAYDGGRL